VRHPPGRATLAAMTKQHVILEAAIDRSVIRGTLTASSGERREFHGWLELSAALEAMLGAGGERASSSPVASAAVTDRSEVR
jgi:hypothetical protein